MVYSRRYVFNRCVSRLLSSEQIPKHPAQANISYIQVRLRFWDGLILDMKQIGGFTGAPFLTRTHVSKGWYQDVFGFSVTWNSSPFFFDLSSSKISQPWTYRSCDCVVQTLDWQVQELRLNSLIKGPFHHVSVLATLQTQISLAFLSWRTSGYPH